MSRHKPAVSDEAHHTNMHAHASVSRPPTKFKRPFGSNNAASRVVRPWLDKVDELGRCQTCIHPTEPPIVPFHCNLLVDLLSSSLFSQSFSCCTGPKENKSYMYSGKSVYP